MVVLVTNLTDAPGHKHQPTQVDIYNKTLDPGDEIRIPADLVDKRLRSLESSGLISIGQVPSWYTNAKAPKGKSLSAEEKEKRIARKRVEPARVPLSKKTTLSVVDEMVAPEDKITADRARR